MLANRLIRIAEDIQREYDNFALPQLLLEAVAHAASRPNLTAQQYQNRSKELKDKAQRIIANTIFRTYPLDLLRLIAQSEISSVLPANLAKLIVAGFPENKDAAISSAELQMYVSQAQVTLGQIAGFRTFASRLGVHSIEVPHGYVALDLKFPRAIFDNRIGLLCTKLDKFNEFMRSVAELGTGSRQEIELVYISTTDPIISCALLPAAAWAILKFYKLFLEVAEKQINVLKAIRDLKNSGLASDKISSISSEMEGMIRREVVKAVESAFASISSKVDEARRNEIKAQITKRSVEITTDIASGARIYVSLESQQQIESIAQAAPEGGMSTTDLRNQIEEQKALEAKLDGLELTEPIHALVSSNSKDERSN